MNGADVSMRWTELLQHAAPYVIGAVLCLLGLVVVMAFLDGSRYPRTPANARQARRMHWRNRKSRTVHTKNRK